MLEQLFGSKARVLLLRTFVTSPDKYYYVRELTRKLDLHLNSVRRELSNLEGLGIINSFDKADFEKEIEKELKFKKRFYKLNTNFIFVNELQSLLIKAHLIMEEGLVGKIEKLGDIKYALLSGIFVGREDASADLLIVGKANKKKLEKMVESFELDLGQPINYAVVGEESFKYRQEVADKFIYDLMDNKNLVLIDEFKREEEEKKKLEEEEKEANSGKIL